MKEQAAEELGGALEAASAQTQQLGLGTKPSCLEQISVRLGEHFLTSPSTRGGQRLMSMFVLIES